ncbi:MAG: minor capsid protein [Loigolactobacillus coryniformis]|uniref:minor capsid protein n=1 Tax=Loigolactobacillus coryniformis TaxID=1610 RepID=UPI0026490CC0|nr:minor capsid protein [Loigolactobacillus coryniformis]MDN5954043.1 minor capsid protein [Loigolactobacillus coryniformis]
MASNNYWIEREKKNIQQNLKADASFAKELRNEYSAARKDIQAMIAENYERLAAKEHISLAEAKKRVSKMDVQDFSATAAKMVKAKDFSPEANERLRLYNATMRINQLENLKSQIGLKLIGTHSTIVEKIITWLTKKYRGEIERQAGILGEDRLTVSDDQIKQIINSSFHNATWSQRIWASQDELKARLDVLLRRSLINGTGPRALAGQLRQTFDVSAAQAERLMRTETARVQDSASMDMFKKYGIKQVKWVAEPSACRICLDIASHNDGIYDFDEVPMIPAHANCRCAKAAYVTD